MVRLAPAVAMLVLLGVAGCGGGGDATPAPSPRPAALMLDFESGIDTAGGARTVANSGTGRVRTEVHTTGNAAVTVVPGPDGGKAVRFPAYTGAATAPAAVLAAVDEGGGALDPGDGPFSFGASFELDQQSSGSAADNGDNLVQRGTFDSPAQFKIQLDHGVPSCRIKGATGEVMVTAGDPVDPGSWYSVSCSRDGSDVKLTVKAYDGGAGAGTWHTSGPTGTISLDGLPLTVGGKTGPDGTPTASPDQFNGAVDNVFLRLG